MTTLQSQSVKQRSVSVKQLISLERKGRYEDALELFERLRASVFVPYHWGTFRHVTATAHDAINRLKARLASHHLSDAVKILEPGETLEVSAGGGLPAH